MRISRLISRNENKTDDFDATHAVVIQISLRIAKKKSRRWTGYTVYDVWPENHLVMFFPPFFATIHWKSLVQQLLFYNDKT